MGIIELVTSGGVTGLLGGVISQVFSYMQYGRKIEEKKLDLSHEVRLHKLNLQAEQEETERELMIVEQGANKEVAIAAYKHDTDTGTPSLWVTNVIKLMRPGLSLFLVLTTVLLFFTTTIVGLQVLIAQAIVFCTISVVTFWFGDRTIAKNIQKYQENNRLPWQS